jgi:hypothetical protein
MKHWVDEVLSRQGIELAPGRAEKMAPGVEGLLAAVAKDPLLGELEFEVDPTTYTLARDHLK